MDEDEIREIKRHKRVLYGIGAAGLLLLIGANTIYLFVFAKLTQAKEIDAESLGQYGDFLGGLLNPFFAFLSFIGLLWTISTQREGLAIQRRELKNSNHTLTATKEELALTRMVAEEQITHLKNESRRRMVTNELPEIERQITEITEKDNDRILVKLHDTPRKDLESLGFIFGNDEQIRLARSYSSLKRLLFKMDELLLIYKNSNGEQIYIDKFIEKYSMEVTSVFKYQYDELSLLTGHSHPGSPPASAQ